MSCHGLRVQSKHILVLCICAFMLVCLSLFATGAFAASANNEQCLQCHGNPDFKIEKDGVTKSLYVDGEAWKNSAHSFATCNSCHPGTEAFPHNKTAAVMPDSCSTCHPNEVAEYKKSDHAQGFASCVDCHGDMHTGQSQKDMPVARKLQNHVETCGQCHEGRIMESYQESFHGKAVSLGGTNVPSCVTCHGAHAVTGPDDPASPVAKANIPNTCATCHPEPQANMAAGTEHFVLDREGPGKPMFYTFKFFTWLTIITITLLIIHIELELFRRLRNLKK
ncbi:MAG TPA: hypothetical protein GXX34_07865 [Clostridia bacterium]|nr:hypothetical protein [Clostridia bacterium]